MPLSPLLFRFCTAAGIIQMLPVPAGGSHEVIHAPLCSGFEREGENSFSHPLSRPLVSDPFLDLDQIPVLERKKYEPEPVLIKVSGGKVSLTITGKHFLTACFVPGFTSNPALFQWQIPSVRSGPGNSSMLRATSCR